MSILLIIAILMALVVVVIYWKEIKHWIKKVAIKHFPWMRVLQPQVTAPSKLQKIIDRDTALSALSEENAELKRQLEKYRRQINELEKKIKFPAEIKLYDALNKEKNAKIKRFMSNSFVISRPNTKVMSKDGGILGALMGIFIGPYGKTMVAFKEPNTGRPIYLGPEDMATMFPPNFIRSLKNGVLPVNYDDQLELVPDAYIGRVA